MKTLLAVGFISLATVAMGLYITDDLHFPGENADVDQDSECDVCLAITGSVTLNTTKMAEHLREACEQEPRYSHRECVEDARGFGRNMVDAMASRLQPQAACEGAGSCEGPVPPARFHKPRQSINGRHRGSHEHKNSMRGRDHGSHEHKNSMRGRDHGSHEHTNSMRGRDHGSHEHRHSKIGRGHGNHENRHSMRGQAGEDERLMFVGQDDEACDQCHSIVIAIDRYLRHQRTQVQRATEDNNCFRRGQQCEHITAMFADNILENMLNHIQPQPKCVDMQLCDEVIPPAASDSWDDRD